MNDRDEMELKLAKVALTSTIAASALLLAWWAHYLVSTHETTARFKACLESHPIEKCQWILK